MNCLKSILLPLSESVFVLEFAYIFVMFQTMVDWYTQRYRSGLFDCAQMVKKGLFICPPNLLGGFIIYS